MDEDRRRAESFGAVAREYESARPDYPAAAVAWLAAELDIGAGRDVLDLGAGTGKLTRQIAELGANVVAVEPLDGMRAELERALPGIEAFPGTAEAIPLADRSVDVVTCAQAFHWFDADRALPEMWRVLRPKGGVGLMWNLRDEDDPFQARLTKIVGESDRGWSVGAFFSDAAGRSGFFAEGREASFRHEQLLLRTQLVDRVASMSAVAVLGEQERSHVYGRVQKLADSVAGPIRLAYVTWANAFRRRD